MRRSFVVVGALVASCRVTGCLPEGTDEIVLSVDGVSRRLLVRRPPDGAQRPLPLVLDLHGSFGTAESHAKHDGMDAVADAHGFLLAYPEGAIPLEGGYAWNVPGMPLAGGSAVPPGAQDDALFFERAIAELRKRYPIDPKRIYATGFSGGARMASELGCALPDVFAAVAPVAGLRFPDPCKSSSPMAVVAFHGRADDVNPYDRVGDGYWTYGVPSAAAQWAAHDGCGATPTTSEVRPGVTLSRYGGCTGGAEVALYSIAGAGHVWPGAPTETQAIGAGEAMWAFFQTHVRP